MQLKHGIIFKTEDASVHIFLFSFWVSML